MSFPQEKPLLLVEMLLAHIGYSLLPEYVAGELRLEAWYV
jgi:hypothetical protein